MRNFGAEEGTRTPTPLRVRGPEPRASANSATSAQETCLDKSARQAASLSLANEAGGVKLCSGRGIGAGKSAPPHLLDRASTLLHLNDIDLCCHSLPKNGERKSL